MKKTIIIFSIFLFLSLTVGSINIFAQAGAKTLTQGIYSARDSNLLIGTPITVRITSPNDKALVMVIDSNLYIYELIKLGPQNTEHILRPLDYNSSVIIFGSGSVTFSWKNT